MLYCCFDINDRDEQTVSHIICEVNLVKNHRMHVSLNYYLLLVRDLYFILISVFKNAFKLGGDSLYCVLYILPGIASFIYYLKWWLIEEIIHNNMLQKENITIQLLFQILKSCFTSSDKKLNLRWKEQMCLPQSGFPVAK